MDKIEIIERISKLRTRANLSARALSQRIDLNDGYINRLESKKDFLPSVEVLLKIIEVCNSSPAEFFYRDMDAYKSDLPIIELLDAVDQNSKTLVKELIQRMTKS
ncbi:MAG: helix-turn-helix domain-containing protein [Firmicutes bacterium]|nr:helix-turn-helix domain-containing protein [Bacillota bacterium]